MSVPPRTAFLALAVVSLLAPSTVRADTLQAPPEVMAAADGSFTYDAVFTKGPGNAQFGGMSWYGVVNVQGALVGDGFCVTTVEPGWTLRFTVSGQLTDPSLPGRVDQDVYFCDAPGRSSSTTILVFAPASVGGAPSRALLWNEPNPFTARTTFHYFLPEAGPMSLRIYDLAGRLVARVVEGVVPAGPHEATWGPSTPPDIRSTNGVLFARLTFGGRTLLRRMVLLR